MPVTATHEELADVMLTAIAGMQRRCDEEAPGWAALLDPLAECRAACERRERRVPSRPRGAGEASGRGRREHTRHGHASHAYALKP